MDTLRRLAHSPAPGRFRGYRAEMLAAAGVAGGLLGMLTGAY